MSSVFFGWIPTVSGALSYSAFGDVSHPPRTNSANRTDGKSRFLICYRGRDSSDIFLPFKSILGPKLLGLRGKLWFVCLASAKTIEKGGQEHLEGIALIFHDKEVWRGTVQTAIRAAQNHLRKFRYGADGTDLDAYFGTTFADLCNSLPKYSAFNVTFSISRPGITRITIPEPMLVAQDAPKLPSESPKREHIVHILAAQVFFFLRDIGHRHQHHDPYTDTIVDLYRHNSADPLEWKLQTLFALYRKIISYKRLREHGSFAASRGVLAYADTFRNVILTEASPDDKKRLPHFFSENVAASISAVNQEMQRQNERRNSAWSVTRELIIACLAFVISIVGIFQITDAKPNARPAEVLVFLAESLISFPVTTLGVIVVAIWLVRMTTGARNPTNYKLVRLVFRLLQPLDIKKTIACFGSMGLVMLLLALHLIGGMELVDLLGASSAIVVLLALFVRGIFGPIIFTGALGAIILFMLFHLL